jgi:SOS response regulatory protein OraA/RecX
VKGIGRDIIEDAFEDFDKDNLDDNYENNQNPQYDIIRKYIVKRIKEDMDNKYESKIIMSLLRKGFMYEDIVNVLQEEKNTIFCG